MQGWLFYAMPSFWDLPSVEALLKDIPDDRMIILDLANESYHGWEVNKAFFGKQWIYSMIHNYGGVNQLHGELGLYARDAAGMLKNEDHGNNVGFGIAPEGIEQNEIVYELLSDVAWTDAPVELEDWIAAFCKSRYGSYPKQMKAAYHLFQKSCYGIKNEHPLNLYQALPRSCLKKT